ncbi:DNA primase [Corallincola spongiicola]|uniref:DNA primase n=1 Tax=Corallincola spongiicola TaxID=2520508 RepID=A0ABY1WR71_9GAMM|nr:DNA primase [Corallincola spongiicola]TAA47217.1 DNA primase [Corallincola spongiicola]
MAGHIPREFIDDLLARTDIVEVVDSRVRLKKAGKNYGACCPFHNEKTPSFTVSQDKQFYHCFGCGAHGNAIDFIMEYERLEFVDAIDELAGQMGLEVPREQRSGKSPQAKQASAEQKRDGYELMEQLARFYQAQLRQNPNSKKVVEYLKQRGLSGETARDWEIGYAPADWDGVFKAFGHTAQQQEQLLSLGMLIENDNKRRYDRFRDRVMFPIRDKRGRVIGFGGRIIDDGTPKYLNSPETPLFHKGLELYGLYQVKEAERKPKQVVIVEGYMDVVALSQYEINYAVASLGTATSREQLQTLFRLTDKVVCCYDGDRAGREAAWRALENALPLLKDGIQLRFVFLPDGEDPDSLVQAQGKAAFEQIIDDAQPMADFLFQQLTAQVDMNQQEGRAKFAQLASPLISKMPDGVMREMMTDKLCQRLAMPRETLEKLLTPAQEDIKKQPTAQQKRTPVRTAIATLLQHPELGQTEQVKALHGIDAFADITMPGVPLLKRLIEQTIAEPLTTARLLERWRETPEYSSLAKLASWELHVDEESCEPHFFDTLEKLLNMFVEQRTELLLARARENRLSAEEKQELQQLLRERQQIETTP